jgi:hypothetical protein
MPEMRWNRHIYSAKYYLLNLVGIVLILTGCNGGGSGGNAGGGNGDGVNTPPVVKQTTISVSTPNVSMAVGHSASLSVMMNYVNGTTADITSQATWTSADSAVVSVGVNSGVLTGVSAGGPVTITATLNGLTSTTSVLVSTVPGSSGVSNAMVTGRYDHTASLLTSGPNSGQVLVTGGYDTNGATLSSTELYAPSTNTWSFATPINAPRGDHTTVTLPDGRVLITGGSDNAGNIFASTELYDPVTATWTVTGPLNDARTYNATTLLTSTGQVFVAGGNDNSYSGITNTAEIYTPVASSSTGTWVTIRPMNVAREIATATF